jgi:hypothetical protein
MICATSATAGQKTLEVLESAAETDELALTSSPIQTVFLRECDHCPMLALSIDSATQYFDGKSRITLARAAAVPRGATVFFDKQSRIVSRIVFWR